MKRPSEIRMVILGMAAANNGYDSDDFIQGCEPVLEEMLTEGLLTEQRHTTEGLTEELYLNSTFHLTVRGREVARRAIGQALHDQGLRANGK